MEISASQAFRFLYGPPMLFPHSAVVPQGFLYPDRLFAWPNVHEYSLVWLVPFFHNQVLGPLPQILLMRGNPNIRTTRGNVDIKARPETSPGKSAIFFIALTR